MTPFKAGFVRSLLSIRSETLSGSHLQMTARNLIVLARQQMRSNDRELNKAVRELQRDKGANEREQKKLVSAENILRITSKLYLMFP